MAAALEFVFLVKQIRRHASNREVLTRLIEDQDDIYAQFCFDGQLTVAKLAEVCLLVDLNIVGEPSVGLNHLLFDKFFAAVVQGAFDLDLRWCVVANRESKYVLVRLHCVETMAKVTKWLFDDGELLRDVLVVELLLKVLIDIDRLFEKFFKVLRLVCLLYLSDHWIVLLFMLALVALVANFIGLVLLHGSVDQLGKVVRIGLVFLLLSYDIHALIGL